MCGFVGLIGKNNIDIQGIKEVKKMNHVIMHRGPDNQHMYIDENICFGFSRLSIIDLDGGNQPFVYKEGDYVLVFNGEIYNYKSLKEELISKGVNFKSDTEAEVIIQSYINYGEGFIKELRGMFAILLYDKRSKKVICARDQFGIKPLYYYKGDSGYYISSEMKAFRCIEGFKNKLSQEQIHNYLSFQYVPEPNTIYENVKILEAGHMCIIDEFNNQTMKKYWEFEFKTPNVKTEGKLESIRRALEDSVEHHMISDVPIATFLSGGIDSTIITALASRINPSIDTYTVGFDINGYSEIENAKRTAEFLGVNNIHKSVSYRELVEELPKIIHHLDGPMADPSAIPIYFICKEVAKRYKVVLSGEGADELFGGYRIYNEPIALKGFEYIPRSVKRVVAKVANVLPENLKGKNFLQRGCMSIEDRYIGNAKIFTNEEKIKYLNKYVPEYVYQNVTKEFYDKAKNYDGTTKMQYVDINTWLRGDILVKSDRLSMANSLELRVPFLDKEVYKVAQKLNLNEKISRGETKVLLREAFKNLIPNDVYGRKKLGYPVPIRIWLKDELYEWARDNIMYAKNDIIHKGKALELLEGHRKGIMDNSRKIWTIITFNIWSNSNL